MINTRQTLTGLILGTLVSCGQINGSYEKLFDEDAQSLTTSFSKSIFNREIIHSKDILDTLHILSDTIFTDTAEYFRTPKATIYANNKAMTYFKVFEKPKGTITAIIFFKNKTEINVAEYYGNGQVMCKWNATEDGVRDGHYSCYYENGEFRRTGYYRNGKEIEDSFRRYQKK